MSWLTSERGRSESPTVFGQSSLMVGRAPMMLARRAASVLSQPACAGKEHTIMSASRQQWEEATSCAGNCYRASPRDVGNTREAVEEHGSSVGLSGCTHMPTSCLGTVNPRSLPGHGVPQNA